MGDFNSRIEGFRYANIQTQEIRDNRKSTLEALEKSHYNGLFSRDQLMMDVLRFRNNNFNPFREGHTSLFAPTFKVKPGLEKLKEKSTKE